MKKTLFLCIVALLLVPTYIFSQPVGEQNYFFATHSHNDYHQNRPLFTALESGMNSIEADVYYVEFPIIDDKGRSRVVKELLVAHDWEEITTEPGWRSYKGTLEELYLDPLYEIYNMQGGRIYDSAEQKLLLHVDFKTDTEKTWSLLQSKLKNYPGMFTVYQKDSTKVEEAPVIIYTNAEPDIIPDQWSTFYSTVDGRFGNIYDPKSWESDRYLDRKHRTVIVSSNYLSYNDLTKMFDYHVSKETIIKEYKDKFPFLETIEFHDALRKSVDGERFKLANTLVYDGKISPSAYFIEHMEMANAVGKKHNTLMRFWSCPDTKWLWDITTNLEYVVTLTDYPEDLKTYLLTKRQ